VLDVLKGFARSSLDTLLYEAFTGLRSAIVYLQLSVITCLQSSTLRAGLL
jgi:hypothetical protein